MPIVGTGSVHTMKGKSVVLVTGHLRLMNILYNALKEGLTIKKIILEDPEPRADIFFRRLKRLGVVTVIGQNLFKLVVIRCLKSNSRERMRKLSEEYNFNPAPVDAADILRVKSINSDEAIALLKRLEPDVVAVCGARVISERVLQSIPARFVNLHLGIAPAFRGLCTIYWALVHGNDNACGITVHFIDKGIDTGPILEQKTFSPGNRDNVATYDWMALGEGLPVLKSVLADVLDGRAWTKQSTFGESRLWTYPTLWAYMSNAISRGIK